MPTPDDEMLSPGLVKRLKAALDEVTPPSPLLSSARYRLGGAKRLSRAWRFAPALVAIAAAGAALTATAATGSPNPEIWKDRAGTVLQSVSHFPASSPKATHSPKPEPRDSPDGEGTQPARPTPSSTRPPDPRESPEPTDRHEPSPTPDSSGSNDGSGDSQPSPTPPGDDGH
jgi:hypothetical protein